MPWYPKAIRCNIPPGSNDPRIRATQAILHVAVSELPSLYHIFRNRNGIESHFYVRRDGTVEQYRDTDFEADANYKANPRAISIETQGMGDGEWTPAQLASIKELLLWLHRAEGIPLRKAPRWDAPGVGYHTLYGQWHPVAKSCPGPDRIKQFYNDLIPWMRNPEVFTVSPEDEQKIRKIIREELAGFRAEEKARYQTATDRFKWIASKLRGK